MSIKRRDVIKALPYAGMILGSQNKVDAQPLSRGEFVNTGAAKVPAHQAEQFSFENMYESKPVGQVSFIHLTDAHAQLNPVYYREPNVNLNTVQGVSIGNSPFVSARGKDSNSYHANVHAVGHTLLRRYGIAPNSAMAYALTHLNFNENAKRYGPMGGFAYLSTLIKHLRASRPGALVLDGGDSWQGSGPSLWSRGQDMVAASKELGIQVMTGHWEFTLGEKRLTELLETQLKGHIEFVAHNVVTQDFEDPVFKPFTLKEVNGVLCAVIGQAFPYTAIAHPQYFVPHWKFGIQEQNLQKIIEQVQSLGAVVVVLLSHNGLDVDLKLASRVRGLHAILGGHTHDALARPIWVANPGGKTLVTNAGSHTKFLGVLDFRVKGSSVTDINYQLLPVFSRLIKPDPQMQTLIQQLRAPYEAKLQEPLARADQLLYRRGNFSGTADQLILNALLEQQNAPIAFSPGFRWGTSLLRGETITREWLMQVSATTYSHTTLSELKGHAIKDILEDVADNVFNPDPYLQQGGDMVRVGGMTYTLSPLQSMGHRISSLRIGDKLLDPNKTYKVAGWAPVSPQYELQPTRPVWEVVEEWLGKSAHQGVKVEKLQNPTLKGVLPNQGFELGDS